MLTVSVGAPFAVELGSVPSTGYTWEAEVLPAGVQLLGSESVPPASGAPGDGGRQVFHLRAQQAGRYPLQFQLKRRWERDPIRTQTIDVEAR